MPSDQELKEGYGRLLETRLREGRGACVPPEAILALVEKSGDEDSRMRTLDHVMSCPACRGDFELLRSVADSLPQGGASFRRRHPFPPSILAWAASFVVLVGAGSLWWGMRGPDRAGVVRGENLSLGLISPVVGASVQGEITFLWHPHPDAFEYSVEVFDDGGEVIFTASTRDTTLTVSGPLSARGEGGLRWWVMARTGDGSFATSEIRALAPTSR